MNFEAFRLFILAILVTLVIFWAIFTRKTPFKRTTIIAAGAGFLYVGFLLWQSMRLAHLAGTISLPHGDLPPVNMLIGSAFVMFMLAAIEWREAKKGRGEKSLAIVLALIFFAQLFAGIGMASGRIETLQVHPIIIKEAPKDAPMEF